MEATQDTVRQPRPDQPAIFIEGGPHDYVESEFERGAGRCDRCGGGPEASIHHYQDPQERIAAALEEIAGALHHQHGAVAQLERMADAFERIADMLARSTSYIDDNLMAVNVRQRE